MLEDLAAHFRLKTQVGAIPRQFSSIIKPVARTFSHICPAYYFGGLIQNLLSFTVYHAPYLCLSCPCLNIVCQFLLFMSNSCVLFTILAVCSVLTFILVFVKNKRSKEKKFTDKKRTKWGWENKQTRITAVFRFRLANWICVCWRFCLNYEGFLLLSSSYELCLCALVAVTSCVYMISVLVINYVQRTKIPFILRVSKAVLCSELACHMTTQCKNGLESLF